MPRIVEIAVPSDQTDTLISEIKGLKQLISLRVQRGISIHPEGDVVTLEVTDRSLHGLMQLLDKRGMLQDPGVSFTSSQPLSIISKESAMEITNDTSEATWEEMQVTISKESNMTPNGLGIMLISGVLATIGIATNALHIVIAAMVIAPGFEPIVRIALGVITRNITWRKGIIDTAKGYAMIIIGSAVTTFILQAAGKNPMGGEASYLPAGVLVSYWTSLAFPSLLITSAASIAGVLVIITNRSILTAGVMIALALVPTATITGIALVTGELDIAGKAFLRWLIEVSFIAIFSLLIFIWKKSKVHKRRMYV